MQAEPHAVSFLWFTAVSRSSVMLNAASLFWRRNFIVVLCTERFGIKKKKKKQERKDKEKNDDNNNNNKHKPSNRWAEEKNQ